MELNIEIFDKLISFIDDSKKNENYELEARFWNKNKKELINEDNFNKIFQKLTFLKENNGLGYKYEMKNILDIILEKNNENTGSIRMSINNIDDIKKYWIGTDNNSINSTFIEKEKIDKFDEDNYNLRFSLNNELPQNNMLNKNKNLLYSSNRNKVYRLKNRYSIKTDDGLFVIDMTSVKMSNGNTFKESNTLKKVPTFEIEIEYIGKNTDIDSKTIAKNLLSHCSVILNLLQSSNILLKNTLINAIKYNYNRLVKRDHFIAASPVTIHRENIIRSDNFKNIYGRYAVTLKADGERNFLIVHKSSNMEDNGKIFLMDISFNTIYTGYKDVEWTDTLIEGELINNEFYMYDILFSKGNDIRRNHLINPKQETSRLDTLNKFTKSTTRTEEASNSCLIKLKEKQYRYSVRNDGTDIFQKVKEIWDNRNFNPFNVDGLIFVPIYEYYPLNGGSWTSLFKWKPPNLNTIDFLIEIIKDNNGNEIKNPFIDIIVRPDGLEETMIKQYKTAKLYVTGRSFDDKNSKNSKNIKKLFNPYNLDELNSSLYNNVKMIIEDDDKIYALDPITDEKVEIFDDTIIEFSYDNSKWIPCRFRKDKTYKYKTGNDFFGNAERTANDIFKAINLPVTEEMITTGNIPIYEGKNNLEVKPYYTQLGYDNNTKKERLSYQNFHNHYIKYQLFYLSSPVYLEKFAQGAHGKLLDLCCGKGVDITKIKRARYAEVIGMDIDYDGVKFAESYWRERVPTPKPKAFYVRGDASKLIWPNQATAFNEADKLKTIKYIPSKYMFDTVSLQFCFHYFMKDEISFRTILQNINDNLKIGGYFIGTCFDGERIYNHLKNTDSIMGKTESGETLWKIEKKYSAVKLSFTDKKANFGKKIDVLVRSIGQVHTEFLVNFNYVDAMMKEYGFSKVYIKPFEEYYNELRDDKQIMDLSQKEIEKDKDVCDKMSEEEKRFSFLSSGFIYRKEKNSSDSLFKKLVTLMEKQDKVKGTEGIIKVDQDMEELILEI